MGMYGLVKQTINKTSLEHINVTEALELQGFTNYPEFDMDLHGR